jgi:hypothetical protein
VAAAVLALSAACGLPEGGPAGRVPDREVPYSLLATSTTAPSPSPAATSGVSTATGTIYLVDSQQHLVGVPVDVRRQPLQPLVQSLLDRLAVGPSEPERARGLLTDLGPGASLTLQAVKDGTAIIELRTPTQDPSPVQLPVAVGQVVLTATSVEGVDQVLFVLGNGSPMSVPAPPEGDLSSQPLRREDYQLLLAPGQATPPRVTAIPGTGRLAGEPSSTAPPS